MRANLIVLACTLLLLAVVAGLTELAVRTFMPNVTFQDVDRRLMRPDVYGTTHGWVPNRSGTCFGQTVHIDADGFVATAHPDHTRASWLLLGDSVCFGLGVTPDSSFASRLQGDRPGLRLWNTASIGYGVSDYAQMAPILLREHADARNVVLFWCLNDLYVSDVKQELHAIDLPLFAWLRRHLKTYIVLKNLVSDRSRTYFMHDYALYRDGGPPVARSMEMLAEVDSVLRSRNVPLTVVILPYEYQLRTRDPRYFLPQRLVAAECRRLGIPCIDPAPELLAGHSNSRALYLYADGIHFSQAGHRAVFRALDRALGRD